MAPVYFPTLLGKPCCNLFNEFFGLEKMQEMEIVEKRIYSTS